MRTSILVTGATGNVGAEVVERLTARGYPVCAAGPDVGTIQRRFGPRVEAVPLDFRRPETFGPAFAGVERIFLVRPPAIADVEQTILPALAVAQQAGVSQVVFLSLLGAEKNRVVPHYKVERYLQGSGLAYTFLRASFFMQNLNTTHRLEIKERNEIFVPAGRGKTSFIDVRDIAAVAALALTEEGHTNQAYALTGGEALDYYQIASLFSAVLGRAITYQNPGLLQFIGRQRAQGASIAFIAVMVGIYTTARLGWAGRITEDTARMLGRAPISLRQYIEDYREAWL